MFLLAFVGSCVLVAMIPGVSTAVILRQTLRSGRAEGFAATLGNETGVLLWALAAASGLSALVAASEVAYDVIRIAGAAALLVMGVRSLRAARRPSPEQGPGEAEGTDTAPGGRDGWWRSYLLGLGTVLANPKAAVFAMSFLPQFVPSGADVAATLILLAVVWVVVDTLWYGAVIWLIGRVRLVADRPSVRRRLERISGVVLIALGLRMVTEAR
ncbi:LysE family translocator [Sphaerisporangium sp. B11E5]|uniref:LysE family translocator n=1 Tax=Sphaerisporangium sp. B11E5 TaxID=3153563 RepID=UPI00325F3AF1